MFAKTKLILMNSKQTKVLHFNKDINSMMIRLSHMSQMDVCTKGNFRIGNFNKFIVSLPEQN